MSASRARPVGKRRVRPAHLVSPPCVHRAAQPTRGRTRSPDHGPGPDRYGCRRCPLPCPPVADQATFAGPGDAVHGPAVLRRPAHDAQPLRRRGPRAGDLPEGLPGLRGLPGGHEPQGLAVPHPHQHLHQLLPVQEAPARRDRARRGRGPLPLPPPGRPRGGPGRPQRRGRADGLVHRRRGEGRHRGPPGEVPPGRAARRRRGFLLQGDRRDPRHPDRHGDEPAAPGKKGAPEGVVRLRPRPRARRPPRATPTADRDRRRPPTTDRR